MLAVAHVLGLLLATFSLTCLLPAGCSLLLEDGLWPRFLLAAAITASCGALLAAATWRKQRELKPRDGFLLVTLGWLLLSGAAALPLLRNPITGIAHKYLLNASCISRLSSSDSSVWTTSSGSSARAIVSLSLFGLADCGFH